jgi:hypothetical protein
MKRIKKISLSLLLNGQKEFEFWGKLLLRVKAVREVNASNAAVGMDLDTEGLNVVCAIGPTREVGEIELDLVPAVIKTHGHRTNKGLDSGRRLVWVIIE